MKTIKYFFVAALLQFQLEILPQDQSIFIFDPAGVSTSFQYTLSQLTQDPVFVADSLDDSIHNYDATFLFLRYPYIMTPADENIIINYTASKKPAYIFSQIAPDINSIAFYNHIGLQEMYWALISVPIDSVIGLDNFFTEGIVIDTNFMSGAIPFIIGEFDSILVGISPQIDVHTTYISTIDTLQVILDLYNLIDDEGFLRRVLEHFNLIPQPQNVDIQFYPPVDTALVNGGCCTPMIIAKNLSSTSVRDSISIEPGPYTVFYFIDSTGSYITIDNYYFIVIDSLNEFDYEVWYHPKSFTNFSPIIIPFDSSFYTHENFFDIQLVVKKSGTAIDSFSQPFHADYGLSVDDVGTIPSEFSLYQNYPNPFNPSTVISYQLLLSGMVTLKVYDTLGNEIATLVNEEKQSGVYEVEFSIHSDLPSGEGRNLTSGIYFYQLKIRGPEINSLNGQAGQGFIETKKMVIIK
jgi:hypothetical protein